MKYPFAIALALAASVGVQAAPADGATIAAKYNCLACHQVDKKVVGPSYKDVAAKYKADKAAETKLADKIKKGGSGVWGPIPMPPQQVKDDDLKVLVKWILTQK
ncbi:c-type cytochrome [Chitinimonas lacunae]|uniref:C-type cytochrome n=1 Tax=Chitinimonas lacunae TaxID=1963018 RepID=A0ABV8MUE7_9NEIS